MAMQSATHQASKYSSGNNGGYIHDSGHGGSGHTARIISKKLSASKIKITDKRSNNFEFPGNQHASMLDINSMPEHASQSMIIDQNMLNHHSMANTS